MKVGQRRLSKRTDCPAEMALCREVRTNDVRPLHRRGEVGGKAELPFSLITDPEAFLQTSDEVLHPWLIGMCGQITLPFCNAQKSGWAAGPGDIIERSLSICRLGVRAGIRACCTRARVHTACATLS